MSHNLPLNMVYLRPDSAGLPVDYTRSIEKGGLITLPQRYLAMYTMGAGPQGPPGADGADYNSWYDTIIASCSDEVTPITVDLVTPKTTFRAPYPLDLTTGYVRASLTTAPTGTAMIIDVKMNGTSLFSSLLQIDAGSKTSVGSAAPAVLSTVAIPDDAEFTVFITQVGSVIAGMGLKVAVTGIKTA
jgi:hypothetical protein